MKDELTIEKAVELGYTWGDIFRYYDPHISNDQIEYLLWNETCYPFSGELTAKHIYQFFQKNPLATTPDNQK